MQDRPTQANPAFRWTGSRSQAAPFSQMETGLGPHRAASPDWRRMEEAQVDGFDQGTHVQTEARVAAQHEIEQFLYGEVHLLDEWRLHEWLDLFTPDARYLVPATDKPDGDPERDLFLVQDDRFLLEQRANSLLTRAAHAEYPRSRTRHMVSNVQIIDRVDDMVEVHANFAVFRMRRGAMDTYIGQYRHVLVRDEDSGGFRFKIRKAVLDLDALRPHGKVSIIL